MSTIDEDRPLADKNTGPFVLTIDVGSSSLRANLFDSGASQLVGCETQLTYPVNTTPDGGVEIDPGALLAKILSAVDGTLNRAGVLAAAIKGVSICSLVSNVLGVDEHGQPTTPIYTWADTRCSREAAELRALLSEAAVRDRTGCSIHSSYLPARLLWLRHTTPGAYERTAQWLSLADWFYLQLFGRTAQSFSVASWGGLLNRHTLTWDTDLLAVLNISMKKFPELVDVGDAISGLRGDFAARWPILREVPWFPCVGDGASGNIGSGCTRPEQLAMQVGTSGAIRALVPAGAQFVPAGLWRYRLDRDTELLGGALSEGGNVLEWLRRTFNVPNWQQIEEQAASLAPDSHGLTILPFLAGERSPGWHDDACGAISGLSLHTEPASILRAAQEAIAYRFGFVYRLLRDMLPATTEVVASGGALLNATGWVQIMADVLGAPVTASCEEEASSRGAALLALRALGAISSFDDVPASLGQVYTPDVKHHEVYVVAMQRQAEMYEALVGGAED